MIDMLTLNLRTQITQDIFSLKGEEQPVRCTPTLVLRTGYIK